MVDTTAGAAPRAPRARLSSHLSGLLLLAGMALGVALGYHYFGRPGPPEAASLTGDRYRYLAPDGPFVPDKVYTTPTAPAGGRAPQPRDTFHEGAKRVFCYYDLPRLKGDAPVSGELYLDGRLLQQSQPKLLPGLTARGYMSFALDPAGMPIGIYEVLLRVGRDLVGDTSFEVVPRAPAEEKERGPSQVKVAGVQIALGVDAEGRPVSSAPRFPRSVRKLYVCFEYAGATPGHKLQAYWHFGGVALPQSKTEIELQAEQGRGYGWVELGRRSTLPVGQYEITVQDGSQVLGKTTLQIIP